MNRIETLREYIDTILLNMDNQNNRRCAYVHLYGVAQSAAVIAKKRGLDVELATMSGMLHDIYSYKVSPASDHAQKGAILARQILSDLSLTDDIETDIICNAIYHHSNKANIDSEYDELLKDADVFQHCFYNLTFPIKPSEKERYEKLLLEFNL